MPTDKSAVDDFLSSLGGQEEKDPFAAIGEPEEKVIEEDKVEKPIAFHKDPKVLRFIEKEVAKRTTDIKPAVPATVGTDDEITDVLTRIIGNDTPEKQQGVKDLRKVLSGLEEKGAQRALQQLDERAQEEHARDLKVQEELNEAFEEVEESYNVDLSSNTAQAKKMRSEFVDYVRKIAPKDKTTGEVIGFPDMLTAFEEFQDRQKRTIPSNARSKELAARGMARSTDASIAPQQGRDYSFKGVEKYLASLSK